jgi:transposase InsO family protein
VHEHFLQQQTLDLEHVQADEIKVKTQSGWLWMAMAMMVSTRLWLGGAVSAKRNLALITELVAHNVQEWLAQNGCQTIYITPGSPWENAYIESFIGKFRKECVDRYLFIRSKKPET